MPEERLEQGIGNLLTGAYEKENGVVVVDRKATGVSRIGDRGDSIKDIVPRGWLFYVQFLKEFYFLRKINHDDVVVDLGCGTAALLEKIYRNGIKCTYIGIDISRKSLEKRAHLLEKFDRAALVQADFSGGIPIKDKVVDIVICSEVIEHFPVDSGKQLLGEIRRILKDGGKVLLTTSCSTGEALPGHLKEYSFGELEKMLVDYGFNIVGAFGLYVRDHDLLNPEEKLVFENLRGFYPASFLRSVLALNHPHESPSYMIEAESCGGVVKG